MRSASWETDSLRIHKRPPARVPVIRALPSCPVAANSPPTHGPKPKFNASILGEIQNLTLDQALQIRGDICVDLRLNSTACWAAIPHNVWTYTLGGYEVLKKWLSYRELPLLGRSIHSHESEYFAQVARRITAILLLSPTLNARHAAILSTANGLPSTLGNKSLPQKWCSPQTQQIALEVQT